MGPCSALTREGTACPAGHINWEMLGTLLMNVVAHGQGDVCVTQDTPRCTACGVVTPCMLFFHQFRSKVRGNNKRKTCYLSGSSLGGSSLPSPMKGLSPAAASSSGPSCSFRDIPTLGGRRPSGTRAQPGSVGSLSGEGPAWLQCHCLGPTLSPRGVPLPRQGTRGCGWGSGARGGGARHRTGDPRWLEPGEGEAGPAAVPHGAEESTVGGVSVGDGHLRRPIAARLGDGGSH